MSPPDDDLSPGQFLGELAILRAPPLEPEGTRLFAVLWWSTTWLRLALAPWGGVGAIIGAITSLVLVPVGPWALSNLAYDRGAWVIGAPLRVLAWLWFAAAVIGVWRWLKAGAIHDPEA